MNYSVPLRLCGNFISSCEKNGVVPTHFILIVSIAEQTVSLFEQRQIRQKTSLLHFAFRHRANGRLELHAARIASHRGKNRRGRTGGNGFQIAPDHRPHVAAGTGGRQNHHAHPVAGRSRTRLPIAAAAWIRTRATFTSTARRTKNPSADPRRTAASISPTRT